MVPACPTCGHDQPHDLVDLGGTPTTIGSLWADAAAARTVPLGRMDLVCCPWCGHTWNRSFDPALVDYDVDYEASLHFSPLFQNYALEVAARLVETYSLRGRQVLEIGSGKGEFLALLCDAGGNRGTGYDPSYTGRSDHPSVDFVRSYFPVGQEPEEPFDLLVCRHVLEHLEDPAAFLRGLAASACAAPGDPVFYFEVPSAAFNFGPAGLWDCIYPHVSYFCETSLRSLLERCGFEVRALAPAFHGQFLGVEAVVRDGEPSTIDTCAVVEHVRLVASFAERYRSAVSSWRARLAEHARSGDRVVMWGAGSKGVVFLNAVEGSEQVRKVVDLNPVKWGRHLPGTGHRVDSPERLADGGADQVLVTNPAYVEEIRKHLGELGIDPEVVLV